MPRIGQGIGGSDVKPRPARKTPSKPGPAPKPTPAFGGPQTAGKPFQAQQRQAAAKTRQATRKLPRAPVAAPPVIHNPTPAQVHAAAKQITTSINTAIGSSGTNLERIARRDALLNQVKSDPHYAPVKASLTHWAVEQAKLIHPEAFRDTVKAGPPDRKAKLGVGPLNLATVNLTALGRGAGNLAAAVAPGIHAGSDEAQFARNALSDVEHLPLMVPQTAYAVGDAALALTHGDTSKAKALAEGFTRGVYGHLARGDVNGAIEYFRQHPIYAALEVRGGISIPGRGAGAAMRSGALGATARRAASTAREDRVIATTGSGRAITQRQHYSPDVISKMFQVAGEKMFGKDRESEPSLVHPGQLFKNEVNNHRLRRRADFESDTAAATTRVVRSDEGSKAHADRPQDKRLREIVGLVTQGVVRPKHAKADLRKELARLDREHEKPGNFSTGVQKRQNRTTADAIRAVLGSPVALRNLEQAIESGRANVRALTDLEGRAATLNAATPERMERAALFPGAQAHVGAEFSDAPFRAAREREVKTARELRSATTQQRQARVTYARKLSTAQRNLAEKRRTYLRRDETYSKLEGEHTIAKSRVEKLRAATREAEATGKPVTVKLGGDEYKLSPAQARTMLEAESSKRRSAASALAARARVLHEKPTVRTIKSGPNKGKRVITGKASVKRAERKILTARAERDKPTLQTVPRARADFDRARAERQAAQKGGTQSLHGPNGERLSNEEIKAAIGEPVAYLPHHTQNRGARAYYQTQFAGRKNLDSSKKRTGRAFQIGATDVSYQAVLEHRVRMRGVVSRIAEHDRLIHDVAMRDSDGSMFTWDRAEKIAANALDKYGIHLVPYRAVPGSYDKVRIAKVAESQNAAEMPALGEMVGEEFTERLKPPPDDAKGTRNVVLVPEQIVNQLKGQQAISSTAGRVGNVAADVFRRTVLPFSAKWIFGNVLEAGVRLAAVGAGLNSLRIGHGVMRELEKIDSEEALRVKAALTGGLLFGNRGLTVRRFAEHFEGTALETPAKALGVAGHAPVVHQLGQLMKNYTDGVFAFNRSLESAAQYAALGKFARNQMQEMTGSWVKATRAQEKALQDVAKGLLDSKNVHDAARYIDETLGQYSRFSPGMRRLIQSVTPFLPWYLNAARFVFWTLPAKHPIKTGIMALAANNLQADFDASHKDLPPGSLKAAVITSKGPIDVARFTPFGLPADVFGSGNEALWQLSDPVAPQFKSVLLATLGLNFAGHAAKIDPKTRAGQQSVSLATRASMAFNSLAESFVPVLATARRIREGGSTPYDNSNVIFPKTKPGTKVKGGAANRILNPLRPAHLNVGSQEVVTPPQQSAPSGPQTLEEQMLSNHAASEQQLGPDDLEQAMLRNVR